MARCNGKGKGFPGCSSCINRELDPFQCEPCDRESNWQGDAAGDDDTSEDYSLPDFISYMNGDYQ